MNNFFEIVTNIGTPIALFGLIAGIVLWGYREYLKSSEKKLELLPEPDRAKAIDQTLTRYSINGSNLTRDAKLGLIREEMIRKDNILRLWSYLGFAAFLVIVALSVFTYLFKPVPYAGHPKFSTLHFRMNKEGHQILNTKDPKKGSGALFEFDLSNPDGGLYVVDSMFVEVLDVVEDKSGTTRALVAEYQYQVTLKTTNWEPVPFGKKHSYSGGQIDTIALNLFSEKPGYDYFVRIVLSGYDDSKREKKTVTSDVMVARFPPAEVPGGDLSRDELGRKYEEQTRRINTRLEELRKKFPANQ